MTLIRFDTLAPPIAPTPGCGGLRVSAGAGALRQDGREAA